MRHRHLVVLGLLAGDYRCVVILDEDPSRRVERTLTVPAGPGDPVRIGLDVPRPAEAPH